MSRGGKIGIVVGLLVVIGITLAVKQKERANAEATAAKPTSQPNGASVGLASGSQPSTAATDERPLPRLVDLGADKCVPCRRMAPILEELKKTFAGRLEVEFIDVWKNPNVGDLYNYRMIPTQIFFDASGEERFRHEGFFSREDILAKWKELGVDLTVKPTRSGS